MPVVFDATATTPQGNTFGTSLSYSSLTVGSGNNRALIAVVCFSGIGVTFTTAVWDNSGIKQPLTLLKQQEDATANTTVCIFGLLNPVPGAKVLRLVWTGDRTYAIHSLSFTGVAAFENAIGASGTSTTPSVTVTSAADGAVVAGHAASGTSTVSTTNQTNIFVRNDSSALRCGANRATGVASAVMTATIGASQPWTSAGISLVAASKTLYFKNVTTNGALALQDGGTAPATGITTTGWQVAKTAAANFNLMAVGTEKTTGFSTTDALLTPTFTAASCWRSENPINGTFANTDWSLAFRVRAVTAAAAQTGRVKVRIWKSTNADGSGATQLTAAILTGTTTAALSTTVSATSTVTWTPGGTMVFTNEYLWVQCEWEIVVASSNNTGDVDFFIEAAGAITTPDFVLPTAVANASAIIML